MKLNTKAFGLAFGLLCGFGFFFRYMVDDNYRESIGRADAHKQILHRVQHYSHRQSGRPGLGFFRWLNRRRNLCLVI